MSQRSVFMKSFRKIWKKQYHKRVSFYYFEISQLSHFFQFRKNVQSLCKQACTKLPNLLNIHWIHKLIECKKVKSFSQLFVPMLPPPTWSDLGSRRGSLIFVCQLLNKTKISGHSPQWIDGKPHLNYAENHDAECWNLKNFERSDKDHQAQSYPAWRKYPAFVAEAYQLKPMMRQSSCIIVIWS